MQSRDKGEKNIPLEYSVAQYLQGGLIRPIDSLKMILWLVSLRFGL